ncbi:uncharacterized protein METZ01_LOCUS139395, partial [marine metagenome]
PPARPSARWCSPWPRRRTVRLSGNHSATSARPRRRRATGTIICTMARRHSSTPRRRSGPSGTAKTSPSSSKTRTRTEAGVASSAPRLPPPPRCFRLRSTTVSCRSMSG